MTKGSELTNAQKQQILALEPHYSHADIGIQLNIPRATITAFLLRTRKRQSIENLPHPGRPRKTSTTTDRYVVRTAETQTRVPFKELRNITNVDVSIRTLRRRLREKGIRKWRAVNRPLLTKRHAKLRYKWAKLHRHWTSSDFERVIWSDECIVEKQNRSTVWVFRRQNKREKYASKNIQPTVKHGGGVSQMIWACFIGDKLGPIVFIEGMVNRDVYQGVLKEHLIPFLDALKKDGEVNLEFQQDNAKPHTAKSTKRFLGELAEKYGLKIMEWPPNSPDLNPIEHLWAELKLELFRRYPDTVSLKGSSDTVRVELRQRLHEVWWDIGQDVLKRLIESMPRRVKEVLTARGWYTSH